MYPWMWKIPGLPWPSSSLVTLRYSGFFPFHPCGEDFCKLTYIMLYHVISVLSDWVKVWGTHGNLETITVEINPQVWVAFIRLENVSVTCQGFSIHSNCIQMSTFLVCNPMLQHTYTIHDRPTGLPWYYHVPYCPQPCGSAWGHTGRDPGTSPVQCSIALTISNLSPFHRWNAVVAGCDRKWPGDLD